MPWGMTPLVRRLEERLREQQEARALREQARTFREWYRGKQAEKLYQDTGQTPGDLNPAGMAYSEARLARPELRPSNAVPRLTQAAREEEEAERRIAHRLTLEHRADDDPEVMRKRFEAMGRAAMKPVLDFYREKKALDEIDGMGTVEEVYKELEYVLDEKT
mgnify:CR=1 FL=1